MDIQDNDNLVTMINISYVSVSSNNVFHIAEDSSYIVHGRIIESTRPESAKIWKVEKLSCVN